MPSIAKRIFTCRNPSENKSLKLIDILSVSAQCIACCKRNAIFKVMEVKIPEMRGLSNFPARKVNFMSLIDKKEFISSQSIGIEPAGVSFVAV